MKSQPGMQLRNSPGPAMLIRCACGEELLTLEPGRRVVRSDLPSHAVTHKRCNCGRMNTIRTAPDE